MSKGKNVVSLVSSLALPITEELGLMLWDVRFEKEGPDWFLRVLLDSKDGLSIDDCEAVSKRLDKLLDELDPIEQSYYLEVSSPGVERTLYTDAHLEAYTGQRVRVKLIRPLEGKKEYTGLLSSFDKQTLTITDDAALTINRADISGVRVAYF